MSEMKAKRGFCSLHFSDAVCFSGLLKLPYLVQCLAVDELKGGKFLLGEGKEGPEVKDETTCKCLFWEVSTTLSNPVAFPLHFSSGTPRRSCLDTVCCDVGGIRLRDLRRNDNYE